MTVVLISGALTFLAGIVILRPLSAARNRGQSPAHEPADTRGRELLRQLRDLDDDLAAGKLTRADHARLRGPVEREAAAVLRGQARESRAVASSRQARSIAVDLGSAGHTRLAANRWRRWTVTVLALAGAVAGVTIVMINSASSRAPGQTITGDSVPGTTVPAMGQNSAAPAPAGSHKSPTPRQLANVAAAEAQVKRTPKSVAAHLTLASAYAAAGASQLAAVEYLAVTRLDPANPEANTSLALLAFEVGRPARGKAMVDRVLAADPNYPEALYVRGLIDLVGLRRPRAAERDFSAYLTAAPFGSHRTAAATMLALAQGQG